MVALCCAPSFMEFLKFRGLWRLLRVPVCFTPGTPSPTENSFLTWREGECRNFYLSLPLVRAYWRSLAPLEQKHFESRSLHSHTLGCYSSSSSLFHIFRLKLPGGSEPVFPPSVLFGLAINLDIDSKKEKEYLNVLHHLKYIRRTTPRPLLWPLTCIVLNGRRDPGSAQHLQNSLGYISLE